MPRLTATLSTISQRFRLFGAGAEDAARDQEIARRGEDQQQEIDAARLVVEVEREGDDIDDAGHRRAAEGAVNEQEPREQEEKQPAAEDQRRRGVVGQQSQHFVPESVCRGKRHRIGGLSGSGLRRAAGCVRCAPFCRSRARRLRPAGAVRRPVVRHGARRLRALRASNSAHATRRPPA